MCALLVTSGRGRLLSRLRLFLGGEQPVPNEVPGKGPSGQKLCLSLRLVVAFSMLLADTKHTGQLKTTTNHSTACAWCFLQDRARPWGNGVFIKTPATWSFQFKKNVDKWFTDPKPPLSERIRSLVSGEGQRVTESWRTRGRHINVSEMSPISSGRLALWMNKVTHRLQEVTQSPAFQASWKTSECIFFQPAWHSQ